MRFNVKLEVSRKMRAISCEHCLDIAATEHINITWQKLEGYKSNDNYPIALITMFLVSLFIFFLLGGIIIESFHLIINTILSWYIDMFLDTFN